MGRKQEPLDDALRALSHPDRRDVLSRLTEANGSIVVDDGDTEKFMKLAHNHLPKLAESNYVEYEHNSVGITVRRGDKWDELARFYQAMRDTDLWDRHTPQRSSL